MLSGGLRTKNSIKQFQENMPLITVVTVVRNGEKTLEETILSVTNQTYTNVEYIVIDGASTDGTLEIIKKYEDRIDYWMSEPDEGIYDAMNKGIDLATGEWINFMNSGDEFYENKTIMLVIPYMSLKGNLIIYGNTQKYFSSGINIIKPSEIIHNKMKSMPFCHQSCFTKTFMLRNYHFNTRYKIAADFDFFRYALGKNGKFQYIPIVIARYDGRTGISNTNRLALLYEVYTINGFFINKINYLLFIFIMIFLIIKEQIKKFIPVFFLKKYRNWKFENNKF